MAYAKSLLKIAQWAALPQSMILFVSNDIGTICENVCKNEEKMKTMRIDRKDVYIFGIQ